MSGASPASVPPLGLLQEAPKAAVERARWWERHLVEVELGLPADADPGATPRPGYDTDLTTLPKREQTKAAELTAFGQQVSVRTIRRRRGPTRRQGCGGWSISGRSNRHHRPAASTNVSCSRRGRRWPSRPRLRPGPADGCRGSAAFLDVLSAAGWSGHRRASVRGGHHPPVAGQPPGRPVSVRVCVGLRSWRRRCAASRPDSYQPAGGPSRPAHLPAAVPSYRPGRCA